MINARNKRRWSETKLLRVAHAWEPLECAGYTTVPIPIYEQLAGFHWAAEPPAEPGLIPASEVAMTDVYCGVQYVIRLTDLIDTIRMSGKKRLFLDCESPLSPEPLCDHNGPDIPTVQHDTGWSTYTISGRRYKLDAADAVLLDASGLHWQRLNEGICACLTRVAGVTVFITLEAFFSAASGHGGAVGSSGLSACMGRGPLMTKAEWLEIGGTKEAWNEENSSVE